MAAVFRCFFSFWVLVFIPFTGFSQFLFPEGFVLIPLDTNQHYAGSFAGSFSSQTQKEVVNQFSGRAEVAIRLKKNILTLANNTQIITNGNTTVISGGYLFARFRKDITRSLYPEYFAQYQWLEARGLQSKISGTANMRKRIYRDTTLSLAAGAGFLLEYEKWNYDGVPTERLPLNTNPVEVINPRFNCYFSYDHFINNTITIDAAVYYYLRVLPSFSNPRLGAHTRFGYRINKNLSYNLTLRVMNDYNPVVPVNELWYNFINELVFNF
ncbi:MAG: hypothetical protein V4538_13415 [Bacteroidota bacterium]